MYIIYIYIYIYHENIIYQIKIKYSKKGWSASPAPPPHTISWSKNNIKFSENIKMFSFEKHMN